MASKREKIKFKSASGYYYYGEKNKVNSPNRLELNKYDPNVRKHVQFKETK